jgi:tetratricopeptide (TPR) repeat protein
MVSSSRRLYASALAGAFGACLAASPAAAQSHPATKAPVATNPLEARKHYDHAKALYKQGSYREAIIELENALKFDPSGKELVYNLAVLHEKLGDIDEALTYFQRYSTMDLTQDERDKTEAAIKRLEGAKREVVGENPKPPVVVQPPPQPPPPAPPAPVHGKIDALTIGAAALTIGGFAFGTVFALKAESEKPPAGFVTGKDGTFGTLQDRATTAHNEAVVADVGFGIGAAAAVGTILLYALRTRPADGAAPTTGTSVSIVPLASGGAIFWRGAF